MKHMTMTDWHYMNDEGDYIHRRTDWHDSSAAAVFRVSYTESCGKAKFVVEAAEGIDLEVQTIEMKEEEAA